MSIRQRNCATGCFCRWKRNERTTQKSSAEKVERSLASASEAVLLSLNSQEDTVRALEDMLIHDYAFPCMDLP